MKLSARAMEVLENLIKAQGEFLPVGEIAKNMSVSTKTISRELPVLESQLAELGISLSRKAGAGVRLEGSGEAWQGMLEMLASGKGAPHEYTPEERRSYILTELLQAAEPVKLFALASHLQVTDGTVSNDLGRLTEWLSAQRLTLVRRPGLGVYVEGTEDARRRAIVRHLYEQLDEKALLGLVAEQPVDRAAKELLQLVGREELVRIEGILRDERAQRGWQLSDNAFVGLLVHLALAVSRIKQGEEISMAENVLAGLAESSEYLLAENLARRLGEEFGLTIPAGEVGYITMHLQGARSRYHEQHLTGLRLDNFHLVKLAKDVIARAEKQRGQRFARPQALLAGLVNHLGPTLRRLQLGLDIRNPLLKEMRERYPDLMEFTRGCLAGIEEELGEPMPEAEVAYLAMHLGAASAEAKPEQQRRWRVAVACPTGMGTSRLLASAVRKNCPQVVVADQVSALSIDEDYAKRLELDFVIATVPVRESPVPVVVVSPLLDEAGRVAIEHECEVMAELHKGEQPSGADKIANGQSFEEALRKMTDCSQAILELLNHFFVQDSTATDIISVCRLAGKLIAKQENLALHELRAIQEGIAQGLLSREEKGSTLLTGQQMVLLHCRTKFTSTLQFGLIHLSPGFIYPPTEDGRQGELLRTAIVMLAPEDASETELNTIGHISEVLLDRWGLIDILHEGNFTDIRETLVQIFKDFYQQKQREIMG